MSSADILSKLSFANFRYLFYAVSPNETTFANAEDVPNYIDLGTTWFGVLLLLEFLYVGKEKMPLNDTVTSVNSGMVLILMKVANRIMTIKVYTYAYEHLHLIALDKTAVSTWFLAFIFQDFFYYLGHRAVHEAGILWAFHQMHHSSEYYNLSTAIRKAWGQETAIFLFELCQCVIIPPNLFIAHRYLNLLYQFWIHSEVVPKLGFLEYIINTPANHRVHHGRNPYCIDRNYGGTLMIWDILFGTFALERDDEEVVYGTVEPVNTFEQFYLQIYEFVTLGYTKPRMRDEKGREYFPGFFQKVKAIFYPPGYFPGEGIPEIKNQIIKPYNPRMEISSKYIFVHWLIFVAFVLRFAKVLPIISWTEALVELFYIHWALLVFGLYFDNSPKAVYLDIIRLVLLSAIPFMTGGHFFALANLISFYWPISLILKS
ncbi:unnamed protein product [Caenorhabditis auriculariae]|uniref:Fatty acid hydroxylase domain-containing protein n=1 Tax=Caenorhabditis auriculariae TaxID=2777116 RepID=A0A8S1HAZ0_9PELO|nr:unnamed protein product [Caenorhabditis auriculariae]